MREATVKTLAALVEGRIVGDENRMVCSVANLAEAKNGDISFLTNEKFSEYLISTGASAVLVQEKDIAETTASLVVVKDPYLAYAIVASYLSEELNKPTGVHTTAVVDEKAFVDETAYIGPNVQIDAGVSIGKGAYIAANCFVGKNVSIGENSTLYANVSIYANTQLGDRVIVHCGSVLGSDGFGLANDKGTWVKIPQLGRLIIGHDVEIGANCAIDRGAIDNTIIHDGVKIDNLVHIAHNVEIGDHSAIAGCVGMAGSTKIGKHCTVAGAAAITGHIEISDNVHVGGMGMVTKSLTEAGHYSSGLPAEATVKWRRNVVRFRQMDKLEKRLKTLENELKLLKGS